MMVNKHAFMVFLIVFALVACGQPDTSTSASATPFSTSEAPTSPQATAVVQPAAPASSETTTTYTIDEDMYVYVHSMQERVANAKVVVLGTVREKVEVINMNRDVEDITKPARDSFSVGQVYVIDTVRYLKGNGPTTLNIINLEGDVPGGDPASITQVQIDQAKAKGRYKQLEIGTSYLFFLDPYTGTDFQGTYYIGSLGYPWRFRVGWGGMLISEGPRGEPAMEAGPDFDTRKPDQLFAQVEQLVKAEGQR